ncbi:hypothetical protein NDU88_005959 [Pleurodeles waltl]|uniref:Uncharacterized protein n=1 Tax=Pleurodeles waltl TaxID=8319 RepID=A0AAV7TCL3_PLEWA|nr:hypothetical protein NDU88_005959 [Pleurodeles waltl]
MRHSDTPVQASAPSRALPAAARHRLVGQRTEAPTRRGNPAQQGGHCTAVAGPACCAQCWIIRDSSAEL